MMMRTRPPPVFGACLKQIDFALKYLIYFDLNKFYFYTGNNFANNHYALFAIIKGTESSTYKFVFGPKIPTRQFRPNTTHKQFTKVEPNNRLRVRLTAKPTDPGSEKLLGVSQFGAKILPQKPRPRPTRSPRTPFPSSNGGKQKKPSNAEKRMGKDHMLRAVWVHVTKQDTPLVSTLGQQYSVGLGTLAPTPMLIEMQMRSRSTVWWWWAALQRGQRQRDTATGHREKDFQFRNLMVDVPQRFGKKI